MKTTQQPSRRQIMSWAFALLAVGAMGIIPWQLVPREAHAQAPPTAQLPKASPRDGKGERPRFPPEYWKDQLKLAEARLEVARAELKVAEDVIKQAKAEVAAAAAQREYRGKERDRMAHLAKKGAIDQALVDEEDLEFSEAQAAARAAEAKVGVARASLEGAEASGTRGPGPSRHRQYRVAERSRYRCRERSEGGPRTSPRGSTRACTLRAQGLQRRDRPGRGGVEESLGVRRIPHQASCAAQATCRPKGDRAEFG